MDVNDLIMYTPVDANGEGKGVPVVGTVQELIDLVDSEAGSVTAAQITDSTAAGRTLLTAANAAAQLTALGTIAATQMTFSAQQSPDFADLAAVTVAYNALLTKLIGAGLMASS